ncbi:MAG TPA: L-threonylcarbamoyladenylate synthase [Phycisphaerales bacterium]|nr:L-threonylcarbamoyladenylate synthase [Phycisphaerales bacterium]
MHAGPEEIAEGVRRLHAGRLVAFPTETVYGLGADARSERAVAGVFAAKGRPAENPLIVHVSSVEMARGVVWAWPRAADVLAHAFWPGPLTLVLPKASWVPSNVTAGGTTVGVRCPDHPLTLALIDAFGGPIVGPSANRSGRVSPTTAEHVRASFEDELVFVVDGGPCRGGIESTVVDLSDGRVRILRPGLITPGMIAQVLPGVLSGPGEDLAAHDGVLRSPGLLEQHYAPVARAVLVDVEELGSLRGLGKPVVVIAPQGAGIEPSADVVILPADARGYAAGLYAGLREADARCASMAGSTIAVVRPRFAGVDADEAALWQAILDRLRRATASG